MSLDIEPISSYVVWADFRKGAVCTNTKLSVCCVLLNQLPLAFCYALLAAFIFEIHCTSEENHVDTWWLVYISPLAATTTLESTREAYPLMGMQHNVEHWWHFHKTYSSQTQIWNLLMCTYVYLRVLVYSYVYSCVLICTRVYSCIPCILVYTLYTHVYLVYSCIPCILVYTHVYLVYSCIPCILMYTRVYSCILVYTLYTRVYSCILVYTLYTHVYSCIFLYIYLLSSSYNHNTLTTLRTYMRESPALSMMAPYCNFEVNL